MRRRTKQGTDLVEYSLVTAALALSLIVTLGQLRDVIASLSGHVVVGTQGIGRCIHDQAPDYCRELMHQPVSVP